MSSPSSVIRSPANDFKRILTGSDSEGEARALNRSWTAVETLLTFCPPGPEALINSSLSSFSPIEIAGVI
jgi:hypothetical protein